MGQEQGRPECDYPRRALHGSSYGLLNVNSEYFLDKEHSFQENHYTVIGPSVQQFNELNLVSSDPDVKAVFPDSESVNTALRVMIEARRNRSEAA